MFGFINPNITTRQKPLQALSERIFKLYAVFFVILFHCYRFLVALNLEIRTTVMKRILFLIYTTIIFAALSAQNSGISPSLIAEMSIKQLYERATAYRMNNKTDSAITLYSFIFSQYDRKQSEEEKMLVAQSCEMLGKIYFDEGKYDRALEILIQGLNISQNCKDKQLTPKFYFLIGNIYCCSYELDFEKAINCYNKGYEIYKKQKINNTGIEYDLVKNLAVAHNYLNNTDSAKKYYNIAIGLTKQEDTLKVFQNNIIKGLILANENRQHEAAAVMLSCADYIKGYYMEKVLLCTMYEELYNLYKKAGNTDSTLYYLDKCNELAIENNMTYLVILNMKAYSDVYEKRNDMKKSLEYKDKYLSLSDSIFNQREFNRIKNSQYIFEKEQHDKEISILNLEKDKKDLQIRLQRQALAITVAGIIALTVFLLVLYIQKKKLAAAYKNIFNVNTEIVESEKHYKKLVAQYKQKLEEMTRTAPAEQTDIVEDSSQQQEKQYAGTSVSKEKKQELLEAINRIMTTTEEYCQPDFSLDKLALLVNSNSAYVSQAINETYRKNFSAFLNEYRIKEARARLADFDKYGNYTIRAIYESVGYRSNSTFINSFKNIVGITPSTFQKMVKEENDRKNQQQ